MSRPARLATAAFLVGAALSQACSDESGCHALCEPVASFHYATPQAGRHFIVAFSPNGATISCELSEDGTDSV